ncbi:rod shape-determining protein MreD [bacterium BMS3Bbin04]|nr:rod shape-determining protein MreD [bacterium BMS3Bbin04]
MKRRPYYFLMLAALILQVTLVPYAGSDTIRPNLPLIILIVIAIRGGSFEAVIWGAATGYCLDLLSSAPLGMSALILAISGFAVGKAFESDQLPPLNLWASASGAGIMIAALLWSTVYSMGTLVPMGMVFITQAIPSALYTWLLGMLWAISPLYGQRRNVHLD